MLTICNCPLSSLTFPWCVATVIACRVGSCLSQGSEPLPLTPPFPGNSCLSLSPDQAVIRVLPGLRVPRGWEAFLFIAYLLICLFRVQIGPHSQPRMISDLRSYPSVPSVVGWQACTTMSSLDGSFLNLLVSLLSGHVAN